MSLYVIFGSKKESKVKDPTNIEFSSIGIKLSRAPPVKAKNLESMMRSAGLPVKTVLQRKKYTHISGSTSDYSYGVQVSRKGFKLEVSFSSQTLDSNQLKQTPTYHFFKENGFI